MSLILASGSPRRRDLLTQAGFVFEVFIPDVEEVKKGHETAPAYVIRLARAKARFHADDEEAVLIAADTVVVCDEQILEKPVDDEDAIRMLLALSGRKHQVMTGFALSRGGEILHDEVVSTDVVFKPLSGEEIARYVASGDPMDKAGGYGIQSGAAYMVKEIRGSYTNVVGLPMAEVCEALAKHA